MSSLRPRARFPVVVAVVLASLVVGLIGGVDAMATTFKEVDVAARKARPSQRPNLYLRAAADDELSARDRLRALTKAMNGLKPKDPRRQTIRLWEARLNGALGREKSRRKALVRALGEAKKRKDKSAERHLQRLVDVDAGLTRALADATAARLRGTQPSAGTVVTAVDSESIAAAAAAVGDEVGSARASLLHALVPPPTTGETAADDDTVLVALGKFVRARRKASSETRGVTASALRVESALLARKGNLTAAVSSAMAADVETTLGSLSGTASSSSDTIYTRSKETAAICATLRREQPPAHCGRIEQKAGIARRFYDFSAEGGTRASFDAAREDDALQEYVVLLEDCIQAGARANLTTNTTVALEWALLNNGRVGTYDLRPMRLRETSVDQCFRDAFDIYRHPRYAGEVQHLHLEVDVGE